VALHNILTLRVDDDLLDAIRLRAESESRSIGAALRLSAAERLHELRYLLSPEEIRAEDDELRFYLEERERTGDA